jgi:hypothetical protein
MRGGSRGGAGRKPGSPNKINRKIKELAAQYDELALATLAEIARESESASARVSASVALLDRAHGKPSQTLAVGGDEDNPLVHRIERIIVRPNPENTDGGGV